MTPPDTSPAAYDLQLKILRRKSGAERLRMALDLSELARKLAFARIESTHPLLSKSELIWEFLRCVLSEEEYPAGLR